MVAQENLEDVKGAIESRKSKHRQYTGQKKQDKKTMIYKTMQKTKLEHNEPHMLWKGNMFLSP